MYISSAQHVIFAYKLSDILACARLLRFRFRPHAYRICRHFPKMYSPYIGFDIIGLMHTQTEQTQAWKAEVYASVESTQSVFTRRIL